MHNNDTLPTSKLKLYLKSLRWRDFTSTFGLVILIIYSSVISSNFLTAVNIVNVLKQAVVPACIAYGMTFAILIGGIDLSVGSLIALLSTVAAILMQQQIHWIVVTIIILSLGAVIGMSYGFLIAILKVPPFIATLAGFTMYKGIALLMTNGSSVRIIEPVFLSISSANIPIFVVTIIFTILAVLIVVNIVQSINKKDIFTKVLLVGLVKIISLAFFYYLFINYGGMPIFVVICIILFIFFSFILNRTTFGAEIYAIGGNEMAAYLSGIKVHKRVITVYLITSTLTAVAALLTASRLGSGAPQSGLHAELDAIAAVVIGGTSMKGGTGKLSGTVIGVLLIAILNNMLSLIGASAYAQQITKGIIILVAVLIDLQLSKNKG